jgi:hypothetical protein
MKNTTSNASFTRKKKIGGTKQYTKNPTAMSEKIAEKRKPPWSDGRMMVIRYKIAVARAIPPAKYRMTARQNVCGWCEGLPASKFAPNNCPDRAMAHPTFAHWNTNA